MFHALNFTSIGASHIKKNTICQDASDSCKTDRYFMAAVSDGHGSESYFRSDQGSKFAVKAFSECVREAFPENIDNPDPKQPNQDEDNSENTFLWNKSHDLEEALQSCRTQKQIDEQLLWFMQSIVTRWNLLVEQDLAEKPFTKEELESVQKKMRIFYEKGEKMQSAYGATLIGIVLTENFWFGVQIGDGKCIAFAHDGTPSEPIPWDEKCFLNITTSICDNNALSEFRHFFSHTLPAAIFIGSDGIDDCFSNQERLYNFYRVIMSSFVTESESEALKALEEYLPELSAKGSGDDMSVAGIVDIDYIKEHPELFQRIIPASEEQHEETTATQLQNGENNEQKS